LPKSRFLVWIVGLTTVAAIDAQPAPTAYTVTQSGSFAGPTTETTIYRNGSKAVVDSTTTGGGGDAKPSHHRTLFDLQAGTSVTWNPDDSSEACGSGSFTGNWGDPFVASAETTAEVVGKGAKEIGTETVNGIATKVYETAIPQGKAKVWMDPKSGLAIKAQLIPSTGAAMTIMETKKYIMGAPSPAMFALPAACAAAAAAPRPPTEKEQIAALTGGSADDFVKAIYGPASKDTCSVVFRVVRAGSMMPVTSGFQVALDTAADLDHPAHYVMGSSPSGKRTFSGGGLHEVTAQLRNGVLRIDKPGSSFDMELAFGAAGDASALPYRQCFGPQTVLLLVVKNPDKISDGADWLYVKSGKYATVDVR
jgi:hypothetical protein